MIKKFDDFLSLENNSKHLYESVTNDMDYINNLPDEAFVEGTRPDTNVPMCKSVSDDPYLKKMAIVVYRKLSKANIGDFAIYSDVIYINGVPGVLFYDVNDENRNFTICRNKFGKTISIFKKFELNGENTAVTTYSTQKLGFLDMLYQVIDDLSPKEVTEAAAGVFRASAGYGLPFVKKVTEWPDAIKEYIASELSSKPVTTIINQIVGKVDIDEICTEIWNLCDKKNGQVKYAVYLIQDALNHKYPEVEGVLDGSMAGSIKSAITSTSMDPVLLEEIEKEKKAKYEAWLKTEEEKYDNVIQFIIDMTDTFCHYVKNNGELSDDDASIFTSKGLYIIGSPGAGKTYNMYQTLKRNNMVKDVDFVEWKNRSSNVNALYKTCYEYNGKLIIMDDSANVVSGAKSAFWKALLQTNASAVKTPSDVDENSTKYYPVTGLTRQERYYSEIGQKSKAEKAKFISSKRREGMTDEEINIELARIENQTKPRIPDEFVFDGCMIIIGNMTEDELARSTSQTGGKLDWKAVRDRFNLCVVEPPSEIIWKKIKEKLRDEQSKTESELPDALCTVPREYIDMFIDKVEEYLSGKHGSNYNSVSWRLGAKLGACLRGEKGRRNWITMLENELNSSANNFK